MAAAYTKEFLVNALVSRYENNFIDAADKAKYLSMCERQYDLQGKDTFRQYASLDAEALRVYKSKLASQTKA